MKRTKLTGTTTLKKQRSYAVAKRRKNESVSIVVSPKYPFPPIYQNKMHYQEVVSITLTSGVYGVYKFLMNSIYDPNVTGTGDVPGNFAKVMAIYDQFCVVSSHAHFEIAGPSASNNLTWGAYIDDDNTGATSLALAMKQPGVKTRFGNTSVAPLPPIDLYWSAKTFFGNTKPWTDETLQGTVSSNPSELSYAYVFAEDNLAGTQTYGLNVYIEYTVVYTELKTTNNS